MKNTLQAIYLRLDSTSQSLSKIALAQFLLKIIYLLKEPTIDDIKREISGILSSKISIDRINSAINLLISENKIDIDKDKYFIRSSNKRKIDIAFEEHENRVKRIIENFFQPVDTELSIIKGWFEDITILFFTEYKSVWIANKTLSSSKTEMFEGFYSTIEKETKKNKQIKEKDKTWLQAQYIKFLYSSDEDVQSIFWDYGTCIYASSLITASSGADEISIETFRNTKFIIDTNILMYLSLEEDKYFESYKGLEEIFESLNIRPIIFQITIDEFKKTMGLKKEEILKVMSKYDDEVVDKLDDPFIKTAKARGCVEIEDFENFMNEIIIVPDHFIEKVPLIREDTPELNVAIEAGMQNEELINKLNEIYKNRHSYIKSYENGNKNNVKIKDKKPRPLKHDAGLISGAEYIKQSEKCLILTREITVKQYGILNAVRDEIGISIGLDNLISNLAIDNGGIDIDPTNFKPLFANMIKLALLPERDSIQIGDLARMLDIEEQISNLPSEDIIDIAKEYNRNKLREIDDEKNNLQLVRRFQTSKIKYSKDIEELKADVAITKTEKEKVEKRNTKSISALRRRIHDDEMVKYEKSRNNNIMLWFLGIPVVTIISTLIAIYLIKNNPTESFAAYIIGLLTNLIAWFITILFYIKPKIFRTYKERVINISAKVDELLAKDLKDGE